MRTFVSPFGREVEADFAVALSASENPPNPHRALGHEREVQAGACGVRVSPQISC